MGYKNRSNPFDLVRAGEQLKLADKNNAKEWDSDCESLTVMVFEYDGQEFLLSQRMSNRHPSGIDYFWTEGDYSCDCNRSRELRCVYPEFPELECGDEIKLKSIGIFIIGGKDE